MSTTNFFVQSQGSDGRCKGFKNDRVDAPALCPRLARYVRGNQMVFGIVRVPTEAEERE